MTLSFEKFCLATAALDLAVMGSTFLKTGLSKRGWLKVFLVMVLWLRARDCARKNIPKRQKPSECRQRASEQRFYGPHLPDWLKMRLHSVRA